MPLAFDAIPALICVVDGPLVRNHGQEQIFRVSEVLVSLNDGINYLLVLGAEYLVLTSIGECVAEV